MEVFFDDPSYERLDVEAAYRHDFSQDIVVLYRKRLRILRALRDERDLAALQCLRLLRLSGQDRSGYGVYLTERFQLVIEIRMWEQRAVIFVIDVRERSSSLSLEAHDE